MNKCERRAKKWQQKHITCQFLWSVGHRTYAEEFWYSHARDQWIKPCSAAAYGHSEAVAFHAIRAMNWIRFGHGKRRKP
jgi:hypothetical protein